MSSTMTAEMVTRFAHAFASAQYHVDAASQGCFPKTMLGLAREDLEEAFDALPEGLRIKIDEVLSADQAKKSSEDGSAGDA